MEKVQKIRQFENIDMAIKIYKEFRKFKNDGFIESIDPDFFFNLTDYILANSITISLIENKLKKETLPLTIVGGRRNKKTLEYGIKLGRIQAFKEILDERNNTNV